MTDSDQQFAEDGEMTGDEEGRCVRRVRRLENQTGARRNVERGEGREEEKGEIEDQQIFILTTSHFGQYLLLELRLCNLKPYGQIPENITNICV